MNKLTLKQKATLGLVLSETYYSLDGFIFMGVDISEVKDLIAMDKEVYILHDDGTESLVDEKDILSDGFIYAIEVGSVEELSYNELMISINKNLGLN